jgi:hypothetical protein
MKIKTSVITSLIFMIILTGCNFNYSESGKEINIEKDGKELSLAKKSLQFIEENKTDSLKELLNDEILNKTKPEQLEWLFENGNRIIENNEYPNDSIITVSTTTRKSISGEEIFKEFNFPFINKDNPDSTMYFKITIVEGEIYKLMLSTGRRIQKIN